MPANVSPRSSQQFRQLSMDEEAGASLTRSRSQKKTSHASRLFHHLKHSRSFSLPRNRESHREPSIESIVKNFLGNVGYKAQPWTLDPELSEAVRSEIDGSGIKYDDEPIIAKMIHVAVAVADVCPFILTSFRYID